MINTFVITKKIIQPLWGWCLDLTTLTPGRGQLPLVIGLNRGLFIV